MVRLRNLHISLIIGALLCALYSPALASTISAIEIKGNKTFPAKEIAKNIFIHTGEILSEEKVKADLKSLYSTGNFADVKAAYEPYSGGTKVVFQVVENPVIENVAIEGNTVYPEEKLYRLLEIKKGNVLNFQKMRADIERLNALYKNDGYMLARVVDVETNQEKKSLTFKIIEGKVEAIVLDGNENTQDYVILRELKTTPGSVLNEETLKKDLRRVFNLGFFSDLTPNFEPGSTKDNIILNLKIKETRSSSINFGGGYGERDGWFGFTDLSINNLKGTGQGVMVRGQFGQQLSTYQFKYNNPWLFPEKLGDHTNFTFRRWYTIGRDLANSYQDGIYNGGDVSFGKPLRENINGTLTLGTERVSPVSTSTFETYRSETIGLNFAYDTRDFYLNPKEGKYYVLDVKHGWVTASTNTFFTKTGIDLNHFYTFIPNQTLALHAGAGVGLGTIPVGEVYWIGGANTVRGYNLSEAQIGSNRFIANVEYRLTFSDIFQGVFFYDWGSAWNGNRPVLSRFLSGWGPGIRFNTPMGPIRLDWGVAAGRSFSEGVMHFSIGQAF